MCKCWELYRNFNIYKASYSGSSNGEGSPSYHPPLGILNCPPLGRDPLPPSPQQLGCNSILMYKTPKKFLLYERNSVKQKVSPIYDIIQTPFPYSPYFVIVLSPRHQQNIDWVLSHTMCVPVID